VKEVIRRVFEKKLKFAYISLNYFLFCGVNKFWEKEKSKKKEPQTAIIITK